MSSIISFNEFKIINSKRPKTIGIILGKSISAPLWVVLIISKTVFDVVLLVHRGLVIQQAMAKTILIGWRLKLSTHGRALADQCIEMNETDQYRTSFVEPDRKLPGFSSRRRGRRLYFVMVISFYFSSPAAGAKQ